MNPIVVITAGWYNLFYVLAVAVAATVLYRAGQRLPVARSHWRLFVFGWVVAGAIGATLPHYILGDIVAPRTAMGAVAFATLAMAIGAWTAGVAIPLAMDSAWLAIPAGAAVVRIGCFLGGCCAGTETDLPIGVGHRHPAQLYESASSLLLIAVLRSIEHRLTRPGSRFLASLTGLSLIRFSLEFVRDSERIGPMSLAQWITLPFGIACLVALLVHEGGNEAASTRRRLLVREARYVIAGVTALAFAAVVPHLAPLETALLALTAVSFVAIQLRTSPGALGMSALWLQAAMATGDTSIFPRTSTFFGGGLSGGGYSVERIVSNCDSGTVEHTKRAHDYQVVGLEGGARHWASRNTSFSARATAFAGTDHAGSATVLMGSDPNPDGFSHSIGGVSVFGQADWRFFGVGLGVVGGRLMNAVDLQDESSFDTPSALPVISLRVGTLKTFAIQFDVDNMPPALNPGPVVMLSARLGLAGENYLRIGATDFGPAVTGGFRVARDYELTPMVATTGERKAVAIGVRRWFPATSAGTGSPPP
jgi:prolipoprotein diacylglyceryltransferase